MKLDMNTYLRRQYRGRDFIKMWLFDKICRLFGKNYFRQEICYTAYRRFMLKWFDCILPIEGFNITEIQRYMEEEGIG